ncbi:hypothetical protein D3C74_23520 [compost metagenome]
MLRKKRMCASALLVAMISLTTVVPASAAESVTSHSAQTSVGSVTQEVSSIKTRIIDEQVIFPMDDSPIRSAVHRGYAAYTGKFTLSPNNGKHMNIYVKNSSSSPVYVVISRNGTEIHSDYQLGAGSQKTFYFEELVASGLSGDWEVYIYNRTGAQYDLNINARQF